MSQLQTRLGYGQTGVIELDAVTRILNGQFYDNEEVRIDRPTLFDNAFEYVAVAPDGSKTSDPVWYCIRCTWVNNRKTRLQFRENIAWDDRAQGWSA